jgi:prepilin-type N-terminal cleavage/methylation domain-containing protein
MKRGFSMLEMLVTCALFTMLTGILTLAWVRGSRGWLSSSKLSNRLSQLHVLRHRLEKELVGSSLLSLESSGNALAYASAYGLRDSAESGQYFHLPQRAEPCWKKFCLYYWNAADQSIQGRELALPNGHSAQSQPAQLSTLDLGGGPRALPFYCSGGKVLAGAVTSFEVQLEQGTVTLQLECTEAYHGTHARKLRVRSVTAVRS